MLQLHFPCGFGAVDDLGLAEGRPMLEVVLPDGPGGQLGEVQLLPPEGCSLL